MSMYFDGATYEVGSRCEISLFRIHDSHVHQTPYPIGLFTNEEATNKLALPWRITRSWKELQSVVLEGSQVGHLNY